MIKWLDYWVYCEDFIKVSVQKKNHCGRKKTFVFCWKLCSTKLSSRHYLPLKVSQKSEKNIFNRAIFK